MPWYYENSYMKKNPSGVYLLFSRRGRPRRVAMTTLTDIGSANTIRHPSSAPTVRDPCILD